MAAIALGCLGLLSFTHAQSSETGHFELSVQDFQVRLFRALRNNVTALARSCKTFLGRSECHRALLEGASF